MKWLNENSRYFLAQGYLTAGVTRKRGSNLSRKKAEEILKG